MTPILAHIQPFDAATSARVDVRIGSSLEPEAHGLSGVAWAAALTERPQLSIEIMSTDLSGRVQVGRAKLSFSLAAAGIALSRPLKWGGAPIRIYSATSLVWPAPVEFDGEIVDFGYDTETGILAITAEVSTSLIEKPMLTVEFDGSGGLGGDAAKRGTLKPAGFGACENIEPVFFDAVRNIGMIDGYNNTQAITRMMEGANDLGPAVGDYATYAALAAAIDSKAIPPGRWGTCKAHGIVGLGAPPVGTIGVNATFGANRLGAIMSRILTIHANVTAGQIDAASYTALDAALNYPAHFWTASQIDCKSMLEALARSANATLVLTFQRKVAVSRAIASAPVATLDRSGKQIPRCLDWKILAPMKPVWRLRGRASRPANVLSYEQVNYVDTIIDRGAYDATTVYRAGNVAWLPDKSSWLYTAAVPAAGNAPPAWPTTSNAWWQNLTQPSTSTTLTYADGTPLEGLKPAQAGADVTSGNVSAGIIGQGPGATAPADQVLNSHTPLSSVNKTPYAQFEKGVAPWYSSAISGMSAITLTAVVAGGIPGLTYQATGAAAGSFGSIKSAKFSVIPGERLAASVRMWTNGNTNMHATLHYFDSAGASIAAQPDVTAWAGPSTPVNYQFSGFTTAPANAVKAEWELRVEAIGAGGVQGSLSQPMIASAEASQTVFAPFVPGPNADDGGDVTAASQVTIEGITAKAISADYNGVIASGTLPVTIAQPKVVKGGVSIATDSGTSYTIQNAAGGCVGNVTVDNGAASSSKGVVTIGAGYNASGSYELVVTVAGVSYPPIKVTVTKQNGAPPTTSGGGGGGGVASGSFSLSGVPVNSDSFMEIGRVDNLAVASGKTVNTYASGQFNVNAYSGSIISRSMSAKWQYSAAGANSWTDFAAAVTSDSNAEVSMSSYDQSPGSITCNQSKGGLAAGNYDIRLMASMNSTSNGSWLVFDVDAAASVAIV